jgi:copper resistance protein B
MKPAHSTLLALCVAALGMDTGSAAAEAHHPQPPLSQIVVKQAERLEGDGIRWDVLAWAGTELHSLRIRSRGEREHGRASDSESEARWQWAIGTWWDASLGWRGSKGPGPRRDWLAIGVHGTAPWFVEIDTTISVAESGHGELRFEAMYELPLTQRAILAAGFELQANTRSDARRLAGAGLHEIELGLRLRYEITRKFAPYVGLLDERLLDDSRKLARRSGQTVHETRYLLGLMLWF